MSDEIWLETALSLDGIKVIGPERLTAEQLAILTERIKSHEVCLPTADYRIFKDSVVWTNQSS